MNEYLPGVRDYLGRFFRSRIQEYREELKEIREERGDGYYYKRYYKSHEVIQSLINIVGNISETFGDLQKVTVTGIYEKAEKVGRYTFYNEVEAKDIK